MTKKLYKFLNGLKSKHGNHQWKLNEWYSVEGELEMCKNGFHASKHIQDALKYVQGDTLAVVEVDGEHIEGDDKQCWEQMKIVEVYDWSEIESIKLAIFSAKISREHCDADEDIINKLSECINVAEKILNEFEEGREPSEELIESAKSAAKSAKSATKSATWAAENSSMKKKIHEYCLKIKED